MPADPAADVLQVEYVEAWPHRAVRRTLAIERGATLADALVMLGVDADAACALHGVRAAPGTRLHDGDRIERLRPLVVDPKQARRARAESAGRRDGR